MLLAGEAKDVPEAVQKVATYQPDLAILDLTLKTSSGFGLIKNLVTQFPVLRILVLSIHDENLFAERVLQMGARGYLMKEEPAERVLLAIRTILAGEIYLSEQMRNRLIVHWAAGRKKLEVSPFEHLTDRELEVFHLIGQGCSNAQIASQFQVRLRTIQSYRDSIKTKLNLKHSTELVQQAVCSLRIGAAA